MTTVEHSAPSAHPAPAAPASPARPVPSAAVSLARRSRQAMLAFDAEQRSRLDRLVCLARDALQVPLAVIVLADADGADDGVEIAARAGVVAVHPARERRLAELACAAPGAVVVRDARTDVRVAGETWPHLPGAMRAMAAHAIHDAQGVCVGAFCLLDAVPRELDARELRMLDELTEWARQELLDIAQMRRARRVQQQLLPAGQPHFRGYDVAALCVPSQSVGGDFYDWAEFGEGFGFALADVMGKGTGAALITATVRALMRAAAHRVSTRRHPDAVNTAASVLTATNRAMHRDLDRTESLVTAFVAYVDRPSGVVSWADAGHGLSLVSRADGSHEWLRSVELPLGIDPSIVWSEQRTCLAPGDTLLCFSDGLVDLLGGGSDFRRSVAAMASAVPDPRALTDYLATLTAGLAVGDDITVLALRRR